MTRRVRWGRLSVYVEPRDLWIGVFNGPRAVYVLPAPTLVIKWEKNMTTHLDEQPPPIPNGRRDVQQMVIDDHLARREHGIREYGTPLQPCNGRSALIDLYQELLDATVYVRQELEERSMAAAQAVEVVARVLCGQAIGSDPAAGWASLPEADRDVFRAQAEEIVTTLGGVLAALARTDLTPL